MGGWQARRWVAWARLDKLLRRDLRDRCCTPFSLSCRACRRTRAGRGGKVARAVFVEAGHIAVAVLCVCVCFAIQNLGLIARYGDGVILLFLTLEGSGLVLLVVHDVILTFPLPCGCPAVAFPCHYLL